MHNAVTLLGRSKWPLCLTVVVAVLVLAPASGQGLQGKAPTLGAGDNKAQLQLEQAYQRARGWQKGYYAKKKDVCGQNSGSLCSGDTASLEQQVTLMLAAAPAAYDVRTFPGFAKPRLNKPFDQEACALCVPAAVSAAAEAAVASVLKVSATQVQLSKSYLYYCINQQPAGERSCTSGWSIPAALDALQTHALPDVRCHPNLGTSIYDDQLDRLCPKRECPQTLADQGTYTWRKLRTFWDAQDHIRQYGAVVTSMSLLKDGSNNTHHLRTFYKQNAGTVPYRVAGVPPSAGSEGHAILLVGYDNEQGQWIAANSWGPNFADQGYFKIPFGESNIAPLEEMYGVVWTPYNQVQRKCQMQTRRSQRGCFYYKAQAGDHAFLIAKHLFDVNLSKFLLDNVNVIEDVSKELPLGLEVLVCGASRPPCDPNKPQQDAQSFSDISGFLELISPRPAPLGAYPARVNINNWDRGQLQQVMFSSLQSFEGRFLYITEICTWWTKPNAGEDGGGWLTGLRMKYGNFTSPTYGDTTAFGEQKPKCATFEKFERINQMYVWWGLFIDEIGIATSKENSIRFGKGGPALTVINIPDKACLASISGYIGKWFRSGEKKGEGYDQVAGLQFDWTRRC